MSTIVLSVIVSGGAFAACWAGTGAARTLLRRHAVLDIPNERSSHVAPTPRGGGVAVIAVLLAAWLVLWLSGPEPGTTPRLWLVLGAAAVLGGLSWLDDVRGGLNVVLRLGLHGAAVAAGLFALPGDGAVFQGHLPREIDLALSGVLWLWFVNLFNFMDGIDGITGSETGTIGVGVFVLALLAPEISAFGPFGLALAAVAGAFLLWNWQPARIFLGDVGSVPLGYLAGWLLLSVASSGLWQAALLFAAYYLADASITLAKRVVRGEAFWRAHRQHFYQLATRAGLSHATVVVAITATNILLVGLALATVLGPTAAWAALGAGMLLTAGLLWYLHQPHKATSHAV